jgi:hypothetical protein
MLRDPAPGGKGFIARNQDSKVHYAMVFPSWKANPDGTLDLSWSTGYVGYEIEFTGSATELSGMAHFRTDTDPDPPDARTNRKSLAVVAHRVGCPVSAN